MKRRTISILLALCMAVGILPSIAYTDNPNLHIKEFKGLESFGEYSGEGNEDASGNHWTYEAATRTLTLDNFSGSLFVYCNQIVLIGESTVRNFNFFPP